ncbi:DUF6492 family protein [Butyrivibrio fibrisolvens]|uniref:DUF6492 family protein n=1 Tax=Butyrivibrio fibrisolvens TaxID=831 RepID=UPI00040D91C7|nr:DUF6492 family protein [Butyrivibrio fibrisolvens]
MNQLICVIPALPKDYMRTRIHYHRLFDFLDLKKIVFIGPPELLIQISTDRNDGVLGDHDIEFLNERTLVPFDEVKECFIKQLTPESTVDARSAGWYYQQFLKMQYSAVCEEEYYLCWDADTVPLKHISMFSDNGNPYFDVKTECQDRYFITIERLFNFGKIIQKSFISEHMLFKKEYMQEMIKEIENTSYPGSAFYEKILYAAGNDNISLGFSEFETYGTYVGMRHSSAYVLRDWKSFRNINFFVDISKVTQEDLEWLSKDYHSATFEKYQETNDVLNQLFNEPRYRELLSPQQFYQAVLESGAMGDYENGVIKDGLMNAPV